MAEGEPGAGRGEAEVGAVVGVRGEAATVEAGTGGHGVRMPACRPHRNPCPHAVADHADRAVGDAGLGVERGDGGVHVGAQPFEGERSDAWHRPLQERLPLAGGAEVGGGGQVGGGAQPVEQIGRQHHVTPVGDALRHGLDLRT